MKELFFKDWQSLWHVGLCCTVVFFTLFIFIRISGKRTLAKLNAFDFIVTVTLGSTLSSMILAKISLAEGTAALLIMIVLQYLLAWTARSSKTMEKIINCSPALLYYDGAFLEDNMKREGITHEEIYAEIRTFRLERLDAVRAVVLELNGEISVIKKAPVTAGETSLKDIQLP
jgi:uncharacterized membrane protein YcaP (DUF421 family)